LEYRVISCSGHPDDLTLRTIHRPVTRRPLIRGSHQHGFTLLEILVVVLIIGIVVGMATLSMRDDPVRRARTEVERMGALITLASQEAVLQSREVAVEFTPTGYHFLVFEDGTWGESKDDTFRARTLPADMELQVIIEGEQIKFEDKDRERTREPRIYLLSGGEITPFEVIIRDRSGHALYRVNGDMGGKLAFRE
jgi:general secretion pathway protein H